MNISQPSAYKWLSTSLFAIAALLFWRLWQYSLMSFHEEFLLFIFDKEFIFERLFTFGGLAIFLGDFLTQFFTSMWLGAAIIALLYVAIQQFTWSIAKTMGAQDRHYPLSFLPAIIMWLHMSDGNVMISYVVSVTIALAAVAALARIKGEKALIVTTAIGTLLLFVTISIGAYLFAASAVLIHFMRNGNWRRSCILLAGMTVLTAIIVIVTYRLSSYELWRIATGLYFYRVKYFIGWMNILVLALITFIPFIIAKVDMLRKSQFSRIFLIEMAVIVLIAPYALYKAYNKLGNQLIHYDYLVRTEKWDKIIDKASQHQNGSVFEALSLNLALAVTGQLSDRLFEFEQHGPDGLIPPFPNDNVTIALAGEIYLRIGMVNIAQRTFFEAQENIMTDVMSGRFTMRLAEMCIINGDYKVARKYINILKKTYTYRKWAIENEKLLGYEDIINAHPFYGVMRRLRTQEDFNYNDNIADQIAGHHFDQNNSNVLALDYALCYQILSGKTDVFASSFARNVKKASYTHFPRVYQEALAYEWRRTHDSFDNMPWNLSPDVIQNYRTFANIYTNNKNDQRLKNPPLSKTVMGYMLNH